MTETVERTLTSRQLAEKLGITESGLSRMQSQGRLPAPIAPVKKHRRWRESDVETWLQSHLSGASRTRQLSDETYLGIAAEFFENVAGLNGMHAAAAGLARTLVEAMQDESLPAGYRRDLAKLMFSKIDWGGFLQPADTDIHRIEKLRRSLVGEFSLVRSQQRI